MSEPDEISDGQWERIAGFLPGRKGSAGRTAADNRPFVNGVVWILWSGARWKDLPAHYGKYQSVHKRDSNGCKSRVWEKVQRILNANKDSEYLMLDSTLVPAHSQAATYKKKPKPWDARWAGSAVKFIGFVMR